MSINSQTLNTEVSSPGYVGNAPRSLEAELTEVSGNRLMHAPQSVRDDDDAATPNTQNAKRSGPEGQREEKHSDEGGSFSIKITSRKRKMYTDPK